MVFGFRVSVSLPVGIWGLLDAFGARRLGALCFACKEVWLLFRSSDHVKGLFMDSLILHCSLGFLKYPRISRQGLQPLTPKVFNASIAKHVLILYKVLAFRTRFTRWPSPPLSQESQGLMLSFCCGLAIFGVLSMGSAIL